MEMGILIPVIITAVAGLVGTGITLWYQSRQTKKKASQEGSDQFVLERRAAYKELWERAEGIHAAMRTDEGAPADFNKLLADLNTFIMKQSLYIERADWQLANEYLEAVKRYRKIMDQAGTDEMKEAMSSTAADLPTGGVNIQEVLKANQEVERIRDQMLEKYRGILSGKG